MAAVARSGIHSIPTEIVKSIVDYLPRADLPATRFISKEFNSVASPCLFQIVPLWLSIKNLDNLTTLSHHPFRIYVEEIIFSPLRVQEYGKEESQVLMEVKSYLEFESDSMSQIALRYGKYRSAYRAFADAQQYLAEGALCSLSCT